MRHYAVAGNIGKVTRLFPAVIQQSFGLVVGAVQSIALFKETVVVHHVAVGHPAELCGQRKTFPCKSGSETARPWRVKRFSGHHFVFLAEFGSQLAVFGVPQGVTVGRIHTGIAVHEKFVYGAAYHELQSGSGVYVFLYAVVEFHQLVLVVRNIGVHVPRKVFGADDVTVYADFDTAVYHCTDIFPTVTVAGHRVRLGNKHQHVAGFLMIEVDIHVGAVEKSHADAHIVCPRLLPA